MPLRRVVQSLDNGAWGEDPRGDDTDVFCIRAADFDYDALRAVTRKAPSRSITAAQRERLLLRKGDIVLEKSGGGDHLPVGRAVLFDLDVDAVCSNFAARLRPTAAVDARFLIFTLASLFGSGATERCIKQTTGIQNLDTDTWLASPIAIPNIDEQRRIAGFLDDQVALLDRAIALRQEQLVLLKQQFVVLADSSLSLPATGVHTRLGYLLSCVTSGPRGWGDFVTTEGVPFFRSANLRRDALTPRLTNLEYVKPPASAAAEQSRASAHPGDVLIGITGANAGWVTHVADPVLFGAVVSQHVALVRSDGKVLDSRWLAHLLSSQGCADQLMAMQYGGTKTQLSLPNIRDLRVPKVDLIQQQETAHMLDEAAEDLRRYEDASGRLINLIQERKQALITAAVTGEFDVTTARSVA